MNNSQEGMTNPDTEEVLIDNYSRNHKLSKLYDNLYFDPINGNLVELHYKDESELIRTELETDDAPTEDAPAENETSEDTIPPVSFDESVVTVEEVAPVEDEAPVEEVATAETDVEVNTVSTTVKPKQEKAKAYRVKLSEHPLYAKYFKMLDEGKPKVTVQSFMRDEGLNASKLNKDPNDMVWYKPPTESFSNFTPTEPFSNFKPTELMSQFKPVESMSNYYSINKNIEGLENNDNTSDNTVIYKSIVVHPRDITSNSSIYTDIEPESEILTQNDDVLLSSNDQYEISFIDTNGHQIMVTYASVDFHTFIHLINLSARKHITTITILKDGVNSKIKKMDSDIEFNAEVGKEKIRTMEGGIKTFGDYSAVQIINNLYYITKVNTLVLEDEEIKYISNSGESKLEVDLEFTPDRARPFIIDIDSADACVISIPIPTAPTESKKIFFIIKKSILNPSELRTAKVIRFENDTMDGVPLMSDTNLAPIPDDSNEKTDNKCEPSEDYLLKTQIVPPVCPTCPPCPACNKDSSKDTCSSCGGQGGNGTLDENGISMLPKPNEIRDEVRDEISKNNNSKKNNSKKNKTNLGGVINNTVDSAAGVLNTTINTAGDLIEKTGAGIYNVLTNSNNQQVSSQSYQQPTQQYQSMQQPMQQYQPTQQPMQQYQPNQQPMQQYQPNQNINNDFSYNGLLPSKQNNNYMPRTADFSEFRK